MEREARTKAPRRSDRGQALPRYDQALRNAKNDKRTVKFALDCETYFTDEDCTVEGKVEEVDKFDVAIQITPGSTFHGRCIWIKKSAIVGTEVLR